MFNLRDYLLQIIFIPFFTLLLVTTSETDVRVILSIAIVILSLITGFCIGLDWRGRK